MIGRQCAVSTVNYQQCHMIIVKLTYNVLNYGDSLMVIGKGSQLTKNLKSTRYKLVLRALSPDLFDFFLNDEKMKLTEFVIWSCLKALNFILMKLKPYSPFR